MVHEKIRRRLIRAIEDGEEFKMGEIKEPATPRNMDDVVEDNVKFLLRSEELLPRGWDVVIPAGASVWDLEEGRLVFFSDFEIFDETRRGKPADLIATGSVVGSGIEIGDEDDPIALVAQLDDITVNITSVEGEEVRQRSFRVF